MKRLISILLVMVLLITLFAQYALAYETAYEGDNSEVQIERDEKKPPQDGERPPRYDNKSPKGGQKPLKGDEKPPRNEDEEKNNEDGGNRYSVEQAISDNAQLTTIAFSGLAYLTGSQGADSFFPPGKVADFFGFQYMRDVDVNGYGHNTTFLTKIASNILHILDDDQIELLKTLAVEQAPLYEEFGYGRLVMIDAFRKQYENNQEIDLEGLTDHSEYLYEIDGQLSLDRAKVFGQIVRSLNDDQKAYIEKMSFNDSSTWPEVQEDESLKRSMSHIEHVAVMTYASELFSWYQGSVEADIYFCPERHGTYFGGFYMKDFEAMGNPDYFISTSLTGDSGKMFLELLTEEQRLKITSIIEEQRPSLERIVAIRSEVSGLLRSLMEDESVDENKIHDLMLEYGQLEGQMSLLYASRFAEVGQTLTDAQLSEMKVLRNQDILPDGAYLYSQPIKTPVVDSTMLLK